MTLELIQSKARINFLPYEEAKERIQSLNLRSYKEYSKLSKQGKLPKGLPAAPSETYRDQGWNSWSDFSGHERAHVKPLPFEKTEEIVRSLSISGRKEYYKLYRQGKLPRGLPANPSETYRNKGWISWYNYLGIETPTKMLPLREAREIVRRLGIKNIKNYQELYKQGKLPKGIPFHPNVTYKNKGWKNSADFLDNGFREYIPFEKAREEIHKLDIHSEDEYVRLHQEGKLPKGMPRYPSDLYKDKGWNGWYDFLGYKRFNWLSFEDAKKIIQKLEIPNGETFGILHREGKLPKGIPATPHDVYKNKGWNGMPDFLGNDKNAVYNTTQEFLSFKEARRIVRTLGIKSEKEYRRLGKQGKLPKGLPANPQLVYRKK